MKAISCKLCGSIPVVRIRNHHVCNDYLSAYYVTCSFCGNEVLQAHTINEALRH